MSTYITNTRAAKAGNVEVEVTMGWDPQLQRFYFVVEDPESDDDFPMYSNLDDRDLVKDPSKYQDLDYFKAKAETLGLTIPAAHWHSMARDQRTAR